MIPHGMRVPAAVRPVANCYTLFTFLFFTYSTACNCHWSTIIIRKLQVFQTYQMVTIVHLLLPVQESLSSYALQVTVAEWLERLTVVWRTQVRITSWTVVFITTTAATYSLGHGLHTFIAVPRSTQPSTLREMVKLVSAYGLINNNNGDCGCGR